MADFPVLALGFAAADESLAAAREAAGLGVARAVASDFSLLDGVGVVDGVDWLCARGESNMTRAAARTRRFMILQSLLDCRDQERRFTLIMTLPAGRVLTRPRRK